jgi:hypothetical protein
VRGRPQALKLPLGARPVEGSGRRAAVVAAVLVACAVAVAFAPVVWWARAAVAAVLVVGAAALHHRLSRTLGPARGWIVLDGDGIRRLDAAGETALVRWRDPFGATVLATADRSRFCVVFTSAGATRYVSVKLETPEYVDATPTLAERATTAAESDVRIDDDASLAGEEAERLLAVVATRSPAALDRIHISDASGEPIVLDCGELRVGARHIDLSAPLEWRSFFFQEAGAHAVNVCQATYVRQGETEVVLVAPLPGDGVWQRDINAAEARASMPGLGVHPSLARDVRLMQASAGDPPPRELRRAIDHVFMLPLRRALDRAPRISRVPSSPSRTAPEGRA